MIDIYWCIHRQCWSLRDPQRQRVVAHAPHVYLRNARFIVRESGRLRVLREQCKNVHAYVRGALVPERDLSAAHQGPQIRYNPYEMAQFQWAASGLPVQACPLIELTPNGHVYALTVRQEH